MTATNALLTRTPDQLTPAWAQRIIDQQAPGARVAGVRILGLDHGTTTRVRVAVDHDGPAEFPRRWFVKLPSANWRARLITALPRLLQNEVRFYHELAREVPIECPRLLAASARPGHGACLVLADVTETGARAGQPAAALTPAGIRAMTVALARLHAAFQLRPHLTRDHAWLGGPVRRLEDRLGAILGPALMRRGLVLARSQVPARLRAPALAYAAERRRIMAFLDRGPRTLVHHDCHPGNLYWRDSIPGLLDWQLPRLGEGIGDMAYLLATALEPEDRRRQEEALINVYREHLTAAGVGAPAGDELWRRYRAHLTYPLEAMLLTLAVGGLMDPCANRELIRRAAAAAVDLRAFERLPL